MFIKNQEELNKIVELKYFKFWEIADSQSNQFYIDDEAIHFLKILDEFRDFIKTLLHIKKLYVPSKIINSHSLSIAVDCFSDEYNLEELFVLANDYGKFSGIGINQGFYLHLDTKQRPAPKTFWIKTKDELLVFHQFSKIIKYLTQNSNF